MSEVNEMAHQDSPARAGRVTRMRLSSLGLVTMLILQFVLGMIDNLYGTAPAPGKPVGLFSSPVLALHVILAILLIIAAAMQLVRAIAIRHVLGIRLSAVGLAMIVGSFFAGLGFTGDGSAGASLGMSIGFAVALACYVALVFLLVPQPMDRSATT